MILPQSQKTTYQSKPVDESSNQSTSSEKFNGQCPFYNKQQQVNSQLAHKSTEPSSTGAAHSFDALSRVIQPQIQGNLVTVNAEHIAPMTSQCTTFQSGSDKRISTQLEPNVLGNGSFILPNHDQNIHGRTNSGPSTSQQQYQITQSQTKTEEELTEWLNEAYKRKR